MHERRVSVPATRTPLRRAAIAVALLVPLACNPDLREEVGPRVAIPNVTGQVQRDGDPAIDVKVYLLTAETETEVDSDRTDPQGHYAFSGVAPGDWIIETGGASGAPEFDKVTYEFTLTDPDAVLEAPAMDLSLRGLALLEPEEGDTVETPGFFRPLTFKWSPPAEGAGDFEVRVYQASGEAVWYSDRTTATEIRWNGLANRGDGAGQPVTPGPYYWRIRLHGGDSLESTTTGREIVFE